MVKNSPTKAQRSFLEGRSIVVPPTKGACNLLISFIKSGNGTVGSNEGERIALTISYQRKWLGRRVKTSMSFAKGEMGTVVYLAARDPETIRIFRESNEGEKYHPFWANVKFDNGKSQMISLSNLEFFMADTG